MGSVQPTRSWSTYFPRPGSSSGRPGSSSGRSSSGRPGSSGSIASNIIAAIRTNDPSPPILEGQELSESPLIASLPASAPTTVQGSDQPKRSWTNYIPRPRSSSGRPGSSGSMASSIITAIRTNDPSPTVRDGQELPDSPLTPPLPASVPTTGQRSVQPKRSWTNYIPRPRSSSGRPGSSGSMASSIITAIRTNDPSPTIREGQELSESPLTPSLPTSVPTTVQGPDQPKRSWTNYIPRPRSSSGRPGSSGSMASSIITAIRTNDPSPTILEGQELLGSPLTPSSPASVPTTVQGPDQPKHSWTNYIPRPRSSSGRPGSSGSMVSNTITAIRSNDTSPTILEGQELSGSSLTPSLPASVPTTVQGPVQPKHNWTHYIPRPRSSSGRPGSSGSMVSNIITAIRSNDASPPTLEGQELSESPLTPSLPAPEPGSGFPHSVTLDSPTASRPTTPKHRSINFLLTSSPKATPQILDHQASQLILNALERTNSQQGSAKSPDSAKNGGSFGKSFTSMMGGLSSLSLARTSTRDSEDKDKDRGRSMLKMNRSKSSSQAPADEDRDSLQSVTRTRSQSPFSFRRSRNREQSPAPQPVRLSQSDADLSDAPSSIHPRSTAFTDDDSGDGTDAEDDDASSSGDDRLFDPITERNTERNALITPVVSDVAGAAPEIEDPDPVGEGVNVIIAPEPYFPSSLNSSNSRGKRNPRRRKSVKTHEPLPFNTSRPVFQRDRCTITMTQGDPQGKLGGRRKRRYVVASDLSEESRYAVEWGVGTVLRDGDEMLIVTVVENEAKVDPAIPNTSDRTMKLRSQQERQGLAYILVRQVTGLLQRTRLNVTISCQAWHAKNSRHMLLDIVDHNEPTMLIVGSRGLGQLNGILLGSTSHYLIQKCSVPVMVARRRLKRPPKKSAHLSTRRTHVSLAEAGIDRVAAKVDADVQVMRDEIQKDEIRRDGGPGSRDDARFHSVNEDGDGEDEGDDDGDDGDKDDEPGVKVAG